jgi:hypothetical protein
MRLSHITSGFGLLALVLVSTTVFGQNIPNGGFETWNPVSSFVVDDWAAYGNVKQTTDAYEGTKAIRLENDWFTETPGFVATGNVGEDDLGKIPYDEQPLSMRFRAKYDLELGDSALAAAIFYAKGNAIGTALFHIEGNSADTFIRFSVPITWAVSTDPDSVAIVLSSMDLETDEFNGDGYIIFDDFHFATISTRNKEVPNFGFEDWTTKTLDKPEGWYTTDDFLFDLFGQNMPTPFVVKSNKGRSGTSALELTSQELDEDPVPGIVLSGGIEAIEGPTIQVSKQWKYIEGYYQYMPKNGDSMFVIATMYKAGLPIGNAQFATDAEATSYTYFAAEIQYLFPVTPDSASIIISTGNLEESRGIGSKLIIDDVQFSDHNASVFDLDQNKLTVYPNPFSSEINIEGVDQMIGADYVVVNAMGVTIAEGTLERGLSLDLSDNLPGIYILHINGRYVNTSKILVKE